MFNASRIDGSAIRARREELGLTKSALAKMTGLSYPTVANIETGKRRVHAGTVSAVLAALGIEGEIARNRIGAYVSVSPIKTLITDLNYRVEALLAVSTLGNGVSAADMAAGALKQVIAELERILSENV